jgi:hypothetical protein
LPPTAPTHPSSKPSSSGRIKTYQKDLRNLALQERRLRNQLKEDTAELRRLQQERQEAQTAAAPKEQPVQAKPVPNGFEFSTLPEPAVPEPPQPDSVNSKEEAIAA